MGVSFNWINRNQLNEDGTYIYRSTTPFDRSNLPVPIDTLPPGANSYTDSTVLRGVLYYYRFGTFKGTEIALSKQFTVYNITNSGPGPQTFFEGDWDRGYFGIVSSADLISGSALASAVGYTEGSLCNSTTDWFKFAFKGKVLFIPKKAIRSGVSWNGLYAAGLVYGTDDNGTYPAATPVNQRRVISAAGNNFIVRLPRGGLTDPISATSPTGPTGSEWDSLIPNVVAGVNAVQVGPNWAANTITDVVLDNTTAGATLMRETVSGSPTNTVYRGLANEITSGPTQKNTTNSYFGWRPVLELIPTF